MMVAMSKMEQIAAQLPCAVPDPERPSVDKQHDDMLLLFVVFVPQIYNLTLITRKYQTNAN